MTTYTLTQAHLHAMIEEFGCHQLLTLKPNLQEPVAKVIRNVAGQISMTTADGNYFDMSEHVGAFFYTHPAPMSKEDMVKVLFALESNRVMAKDANGKYTKEVTPTVVLQAITIMQSAIEITK